MGIGMGIALVRPLRRSLGQESFIIMRKGKRISLWTLRGIMVISGSRAVGRIMIYAVPDSNRRQGTRITGCEDIL